MTAKRATARIAAWAAALSLAVSGFPGCAPRHGTVDGRALLDGAPVSGAEVQAYVKAGEERSGTPFLIGVSAADGSFSLSLPPGGYFLVVRKSIRRDGRDRTYKGEYAGNPVTVKGGKTARGIDVTLSEMSSAGFAPREGTGVTGAVADGRKPATGAYVYAYLDNVGTVRGPSYVAFSRTGEDGRFLLPLREGTFRIVAREKGGENETGAMTGAGKTGGGDGISVRLGPGRMQDLGTISLRRPKEEERRRRAAAGGQERAVAEIRGTAVRDDGSPAAGIRVMAYADRRMIGRPFSISGPTGGDGVFVLRLPKQGKYYLGARSEIGGPVSPGEWIGTFDGAPDHEIMVREGDRREGVRIRVAEKW